MQIIQWLFKVAHEEQTTGKKQDQEVRSNNGIVLVKNHRGKRRAEQTRLKCNFSLFDLIRRKDISKAYFYNTLHLRRLRSSRRRRREHFVMSSMNMITKNQNHNSENADNNLANSHVGSTKVLPINNYQTTQTSSVNSTEKKNKAKGDKTKTMSKMKELLRWAAAAKSSHKSESFLARKALQLRRKTTLKTVPDNDQLSNNNESPKISFNWEMETCSTISSSYSEISFASSTRMDQSGRTRTGNWITTDSEFVVLEL